MSSKRAQHPKVFISYSWDSEKHKCNVVDLADCLRSHGIDCNLDQYQVYPAEGWQNWMRHQVEEAEFVLLVCTEQYQRRFQGKERRGVGKGVAWEGAIISQLIYDQQTKTQFIPIIFEPQAGNYIPSEIRRYTRYLLNPDNFVLQDSGYEALYRHLTRQSRQKEALGKIIPLPTRTRHRVDSASDNEQVQQEELNRYYRQAQQYYRTRYWDKAIDVFKQMQAQALPYYDPDGIYRLARRELFKEEQTRRRLENIYTQGKEYYQDKNWYQGIRKFQEILSYQPRDREFEQRVERKLIKSQEKLAQEKLITMTVIIISWLISSFFAGQNTLPINVVGGLASGFIIWWLLESRKKLDASQQTKKLLLFLIIGLVAEFIIRKIFGSFSDANSMFWIIEFLAAVSGIAISMRVMSWLINRRLQGK